MFYSKEYNQYVREGSDFSLGGVKYPATWLNETTLEEKTAVGLVEVQVIGAPADDRFYWVSTTLEDGILTYVNMPKELQPCIDQTVNQINATAYTLLSPSDWMVTKSIETSKPVASAWTDYRTSVRQTADNAKTSAQAATTVDELANLQIEWPNDPNYVPPTDVVNTTVEETPVAPQGV